MVEMPWEHGRNAVGHDQHYSVEEHGVVTTRDRTEPHDPWDEACEECVDHLLRLDPEPTE